MKDKGITLVALVITIVILIILATITVKFAFGENGLIGKAESAVLMTEFSTYKEEMNIFSTTKKLENMDYTNESLNAGSTNLTYNTKEGTEGNIQTVIPSMKGEYLDKFEIIKGELLLTTTEGDEMQIAMALGIKVNPYEIVDGVLLSSNVNLALQTTNGVVTIPESVREIGAGAFSGVAGLKEIIIPGTVKVIQRDAFSYNTEIEKVTMQYGVESIGENAFKNCTGLTEVIIPDSVTGLGAEAFRECSNLKIVQLSNNLTLLESWVFGLCGKLENINIPKKLIQIGDYAFSNCSKLNNLTIPAGVTNISSSAFSDCINLYNIIIDEANEVYEIEDGIIYKKDGTSLIMLATMSGAETVTIKEGITELNANQLSICKNMKILNLPSTLNNISSAMAFAGSELLEIINFPNGNNKYMSENGYVYTKDGKTLIYAVPTKTKIEIKDTVETIGSYAISGKNITELIIPDTVRTISAYIFSGTTNLKRIEIGTGVTNLSPSFKNYSAIPDGLEIIIDSANPNYKVEENLILTKDGKEVVTYVNTVQSMVVPEEVEKLSDYAFEAFSATEIILPSTLKSIGYASFTNCNYLAEIKIPNSVENIGIVAFSNCSNLQSIKIDKEAGSIEGSPWNAPKGDRVVQWLK